ncbi:ATP synthase subunit delta [Polaribacter huanghezhanensis]|uniref:ATP synthase F1 subunit delta n=1 Tax=Polaribacter huanghezhanensis TaxID=1354726 RepID=UPI0026476615|nr:ATP synthase F1 subunit delta [Polaribacter huanghezhanensis]WKD85432.1 ATP synthase subunit delta [Polaribacter huanghezhanensis]
MKGARAALRYARAILNLAKESNLEGEVNNDMLLIYETIDHSDDLQTMLKSPIIKSSNKRNVLEALFTGKINALSLGLFHLLDDNKRMVMLGQIAQQYTIIYNFLKLKDTAIVTTAVPLTTDLEAQILKKVIELTGNKTSIENRVDPKIIGGFILRVGDMQYDASLSNNFSELRKEFDNSHYIPKI